MDKQHFDVKKAFTLDAVEARFKTLGFQPTRGVYSDLDYHGRDTRPTACLLGSFEHAVFGHSSIGQLAESGTDIPAVLLRALEAGWEGYSILQFLTEWELDIDMAGLDQEVIDCYEQGQALANTLIFPRGRRH